MAFLYWHTCVERAVIPCPIRVEVIPDYGFASLWLEYMTEVDEVRSTTFGNIVQINHKSPGAIAAGGAMLGIFLGIRFEEIRVLFEFLTNGIMLALNAFRIGRPDAESARNSFIQRFDQIVLDKAEVAGAAGPVVFGRFRGSSCDG
jgi:hypothetical protein